MAWIESHQELARHPKTRRLSRALGVSIRDAIGCLHLLWWWALDYAQDGDLSRFSDLDIADALLWDGDESILVESLRIAGFVDGYSIHDWDEYAGRLFERREANAERMRQARSKRAPSLDSARAQHVRSTWDARAHTCEATGPNTTVHNSTVPESVSLASDVSPDGDAGAEKPKPQKHKPITDEYIAELVVEFAPQLGGPECVREIIGRAMNHKASDAWKDKRRGLHDWLVRDVQRLADGPQGARASPNGKPSLGSSAAAQRFAGVARTFDDDEEVR